MFMPLSRDLPPLIYQDSLGPRFLRLWGTNIRSCLESHDLASVRRAPASALGRLVDLLRISPSVSRAVQSVLSRGDACRIGAADFHEKAGRCQVA